MGKHSELKVVFTTGAFDLFHFGHVCFLREAKKLGDFLLVGVHSDRTIAKYKGRLPVMNLVERIAVVESCRYVDRVIVAKMTSEVTEEFYKEWDIDLHVQGDDSEDWYRLPKKLGIFKLLPECKIFSTTETIRRVKEDFPKNLSKESFK